MSRIGNLYRSYSVVVNNGSGCIFQTQEDLYSYILTVKHNIIADRLSGELMNVNNIKISRTFEEYRSGSFLNVKNFFVHPDKDYAIIQVEKLNDDSLLELRRGKLERKTKVNISGFPNYMRLSKSNDVEYRTTLKATIDLDRSESHEVDMDLSHEAQTIDSGAAENIVGFSGSGIFYEKCNHLVLAGIFPKLNDSRATHDKVVGFDLSGFKEIAEKYQLFDPLELNPNDNEIGWKCMFLFHWKKLALALIALPFIVVGITSVLEPNRLCEKFTNDGDLNIIVNNNVKKEQHEIDKSITDNFFPFEVYTAFLKGETSGLFQSDVQKHSSDCGANVVVNGNVNKAGLSILDNNIKKYFLKEYPLYNPNMLNKKIDLNRVICLLKSYLYYKQDDKDLKKSFMISNCVDMNQQTSSLDTSDLMILQSIARNLERLGKKDSALNILLKISEGGLNPDSVFRRQERMAEDLGRTNDAITAQSGIIKIAEEKQDKKLKEQMLEKRAKNYEKTGEKSKAIEDYKKVKEINPSNNNANDKIKVLSNQLTNQTPQTSSTVKPQNLISTTEKLILANKLNDATILLNKNKELVAQKPALQALQMEVNYKLDKVDLQQISPKILEANKRLQTQIKVDQIQKSSKKLIPKEKSN